MMLYTIAFVILAQALVSMQVKCLSKEQSNKVLILQIDSHFRSRPSLSLAKGIFHSTILLLFYSNAEAILQFYTSRSHYRYNTDHNQVIYAAFQVLYDLILLLLPLPVIFKTNLRGRDRGIWSAILSTDL